MAHRALDTSVIVCSYSLDRWDELVAAVHSIPQQTLRPLETILVVDHNPVLFEQARANFSDVIVIENNGPRGLSGARNSGIAVARGSAIAFLDDDATAAPDWLARLCEPLADPRVLGTGGAALPVWVNPKPRWFPEEFLWTVGCTYPGMPQTLTPVRNVWGGNMCIRRQVFETVGGFRSGMGRQGALPFGCEETELCIRANQQWRDGVFLYDPQAVMYHQVTPGRATWKYFSARCYAEGQSKAFVSQLVGARDGLASEKNYTVAVLPKGVLRGLWDVLAHRDLMGLARSGTIVAGLALTAWGYFRMRMVMRFNTRASQESEFIPQDVPHPL